jgi:glycosyltransferase involved in cell wall biosynthesis
MSDSVNGCSQLPVDLAFIGSAGIPNRYGGFEAFLEHCAPVMAGRVRLLIVTCDGSLYQDHAPDFKGVRREFIGVRANGAWSILHDLLAFLRVYASASHIVVLGVSGGIWFPFFRLLCALGGKKLIVNVDGVEWQRGKFSAFRKAVLWASDLFAQCFAHRIVIDNGHLHGFLFAPFRAKASCIAYPGDHVLRLTDVVAPQPGTALTVCRIEPENNIGLMIEGALASRLQRYTIIGNWNHSAYGRKLRGQYGGNPRLMLLDPVYNPVELARYREACSIYIHGHSVGGTNPSLVEMVFYDCALLCFDVAYHRETVSDCARYFTDAVMLNQLIDAPIPETSDGQREALRKRYTRERIVSEYLALTLVDCQ